MLPREFPAEHSHPITLTTYVLKQEIKHPERKGDFCSLLGAIQTACKIISRAVHRAGVDDLGATVGEVNMGGEDVKRLDVLSNETFIHFLVSSGQLCVGASEESADIIVPPRELTGEFCVTFDPLDGSSNIDAGVNVGTIFGIYRRMSDSGPDGHEPGDMSDILQAPKNMIASGYTMYGASTMLVLADQESVNGFTLDTGIGEFILTHPNMSIPQRGKIYSINEGNSEQWHERTRQYVNFCKSNTDSHKAYSLRYIGTMVGDVHRTLCYGGVFMYPGDTRSQEGKLRLLYECGPMGYVCERAGGRASTGKVDVLDLVPQSLHERCAIFLGSKLDIDDADMFHGRYLPSDDRSISVPSQSVHMPPPLQTPS